MIAEGRIAVRVDPTVSLDARQALPPDPPAGVVVCHPHPLYGGDMDNPVVVRAVEVCGELGLATVRFNFRGVGASTGTHGGGAAEQADVAAALDALGAAVGAGRPLGLVGYSFGARVAAAVALRRPDLAALALVAPPLGPAGDAWLQPLAGFRGPFLVAAGSEDEICPRAALEALAGRLPGVTVRVIEGADHFFLGRLHPLGQAIADWARRLAVPRSSPNSRPGESG